MDGVGRTCKKVCGLQWSRKRQEESKGVKENDKGRKRDIIIVPRVESRFFFRKKGEAIIFPPYLSIKPSECHIFEFIGLVSFLKAC